MFGAYGDNVPVVANYLPSASSDWFASRSSGNPPDLCIRGQRIIRGVRYGFGYGRRKTFASRGCE